MADKPTGTETASAHSRAHSLKGEGDEQTIAGSIHSHPNDECQLADTEKAPDATGIKKEDSLGEDDAMDEGMRTAAGSIDGSPIKGHHLANIDVASESAEMKKEGVLDQDDFPDGGLRAWLVVLGGVCVTFGT